MRHVIARNWIFAIVGLAVAMLYLQEDIVGVAQRGQAPPQADPKSLAPIDLTGSWVAVITEDWRYRMVTPAKGDYAGVPINADAKRVADGWDPARDQATGQQCKSYGAPAIMHIPARLRISWQDNRILKVEIDAGTQTRLLHFGEWKPQGSVRDWQGVSMAEWETPRVGRGRGNTGPPARDGAPPSAREAPRMTFGNLKVITDRFRAGYLRKNGVPYSDKAVLTEDRDVLTDRTGQQWLLITSLVEDPTYLREPWITSLNFKKEVDGSKWDPTPCSATW